MNTLQKKRLLANVNSTLADYKEEQKGKDITINQEFISKEVGLSQGQISKSLNGNNDKGLERIAEWIISIGLATKDDLYERIPDFDNHYQIEMWAKIEALQKDMETLKDLNRRQFALFKKYILDSEEQTLKELGAEKQ